MIIAVLPTFSQLNRPEKAKHVAEEFLLHKGKKNLSTDTISNGKSVAFGGLELVYQVKEGEENVKKVVLP